MLTTEMPVAQLFSIASSAVMPAETGAVADAGRHGDDRNIHQPADDRWERPFHAGDDDDDPRGGEAGVLLQQPVQPRDPDVVEPIDGVPHDAGCDGRFLGHGKVGGAGGGDEDDSAARGGGMDLERDATREFVKAGAGDLPEDCFEGFLAGAGDQQVVSGGDDAGGDRGHLGRGFSLAEDDFGEALAGLAVMIDPGEPQVFERLLAQNLKELFLGRLRCDRTGADALEEGPQLLAVHRVDFGPT